MSQPAAFSFVFSDGGIWLQGKLLQSTLNASLSKQLLQLQPHRVDFSQLTALDATALALLLYWQQTVKQPLQLVNAPPSLWAMARVHGVTELLKKEEPAA